MKEQLSASKVFASMSVFDKLREEMFMVMMFVPRIVQGRIKL